MTKQTLTWGFMASLVLAAACWGFGALMSKYALEQIPPLTLLMVQLFVSVALLWLAVLVQGVRVRLNRDALRLGLIGILNPGLAYMFSLIGLSRTTASMSALLWAAEPILIIGFAWLLLCERLTWPLLACAVLAIVGVGVVAGLDVWGGGVSSLLGNLLIGIGVCCCALYTVLTRRTVANHSPLLIVALQQTAALLWALLIWPFELWNVGTMRLIAIPLSFWAWGAAGGLVYYALAFWLYLIGLQRAPASLAALFLNLIPIFGVGGAYLLLGERLTLTQWGGALFILVAVVTIVRLQQQPAPAQATTQAS
jgi:drug/metabolite transporter (DMT)-like permease